MTLDGFIPTAPGWHINGPGNTIRDLIGYKQRGVTAYPCISEYGKIVAITEYDTITPAPWVWLHG